MAEKCATGNGFNAANAGCHTAFRQDFKRADLAGVGYVGSSAEFHAVIADGNHAHAVAILFLEKGNGPCFLRFGKRHFLAGNGRKL